MSQKERNRIPVMKSISKGEIKLVEAAKVLKRSYRQMRRIWRRYLAEGDAGLVHRTRGRPGPRRKAQSFRDKVLAHVRDRYPDFGPTLAAEYLAKEHGLKVDHETLRRWLNAGRGCESQSIVARRTERGGSAALVLGRWCNLTGPITTGLRAGASGVV